MVALWSYGPVKSLSLPMKKSGGRNNSGRITSRHRGGGHRRRYRLVSFDRRPFEKQIGCVVRFEYDPNRNAALALIAYTSGRLSYTLAIQGLRVGATVVNGIAGDFAAGNAMALSLMPPGSLVCSLRFYPTLTSRVAVSGGSFAQLLRRYNDRYSVLKLPSGEKRLFRSNLWAVFGIPLSATAMRVPLGSKAGRTRWLGFRPSVRGVAMNPVDHPHGGGQGKTSGGRPSVSPWARLTKGFVTKPRRFASPLIYKHRKLKEK